MNLDRLITVFDNSLRTLLAPARSARPHPDAAIDDAGLDDAQRALSAALMRVNHTGEICAHRRLPKRPIIWRGPSGVLPNSAAD